MKKDVLGLGIALLVASAVAAVNGAVPVVENVFAITGTLGTVYGFLAKEIEEE